MFYIGECSYSPDAHAALDYFRFINRIPVLDDPITTRRYPQLQPGAISDVKSGLAVPAKAVSGCNYAAIVRPRKTHRPPTVLFRLSRAIWEAIYSTPLSTPGTSRAISSDWNHMITVARVASEINVIVEWHDTSEERRTARIPAAQGSAYRFSAVMNSAHGAFDGVDDVCKTRAPTKL